MIKSRNADVEAVAVSAVEGKPVYGGNLLVKPLIKGDEMTFLEIHYAAGVGAPLHTHTHESIAYVVKGKVKSTVGSEEFIMGPGDVAGIPKVSSTAWRPSKTPLWSRSSRRRPISVPFSRCENEEPGRPVELIESTDFRAARIVLSRVLSESGPAVRYLPRRNAPSVDIPGALYIQVAASSAPFRFRHELLASLR